jgi:zinc protease
LAKVTRKKLKFIMVFIRLIYILLLITCNSCFSIELNQIQRFHQFKLKNGMEVYIYQDNSLPIIVHTLLYKVGSANDPKSKSGLAHYLEHLMFRSTNNIDDVTTKIHDLHAKYNAMTSDYFTIYYELVTKDKLKDVIQIESERMQNLKITEEFADLERKIVLEERRMKLDNSPFMRLMEEMYAAFYRNDRAWNTIGWENEILELKKSDVIDMYNQHYNPPNAALILFGDIDLDNTKELINKYYGSIKGNQSIKKCCVLNEPIHQSDLKITLTNTINQERAIAYFFEAPNVSDENYVATLLAGYIIGIGKTSRLYTELVYNLGLALDVNVNYHYLTKSAGMFSIFAFPMSSKVTLDSLQENIDRVVSDILKNGITNEELEVAKSSAKLDLINSLDGLQARSVSSAMSIAAGADFDHIDQLSRKISAIDLVQVHAVLNKVLNSKRVLGFLTK